MAGGLTFCLCTIAGCVGYFLGYWVAHDEARATIARLNRRLVPRRRNVVSLTEYRFRRRGAAL